MPQNSPNYKGPGLDNQYSYGTDPLYRSELGDDFVDYVANFDTDVFTDWLHPHQKESRQMAEEMFMTDRQNRYNSAGAQMQRAIEAGINPLTAAGGIAGNGVSSATDAPSPASSVNPLGDIANAIGAVTGGVPGLAKAALDLSQKKEVDTLLPEKLNDLRNSANLKFEEVGLTHAQSVIASSSAEYADENALRDIQMKRVRVSQMSQEYKNLKVVHEQILADIDEKIASAQLHGSQQDYYDALKLKTDEETRWIKADNDFWELHHFDRHANSNDLIISQLISNGVDPDAYIQAWVDYHGQYQGAVSNAEQKAISDYSYRIAFARQNGQNVADLWNGHVGSIADFANRIANHGFNFASNISNSFGRGIDALVGYAKNYHDAKPLRKELTMVLNNAYEQLDNDPDDSNALEVVNLVRGALQLSNKELLDWASKNWN